MNLIEFEGGRGRHCVTFGSMSEGVERGYFGCDFDWID